MVKIKNLGSSLLLLLTVTQLQATSSVCPDCRFNKQQLDQRQGLITQVRDTDTYCEKVCQVWSSN